MDSRSQTTDDTTLPTTHQNTINCIRPFAGSPGRVTRFTSTGVDGMLVVWDILAGGIANLRL
jgi:actin related protein 2/3 complex subunit 1A/1B